jgi:preprotein translocase subunit YajC
LCLTAQAATQQDPKAAMLTQAAMMIGMVALFWLLLIRPQQKKAKEQAEVLKTLKPNDRVVTSAGLIGVVISVKDNAVSLRCGDSKIEVTKASITEVTERAS